MRDPKLPAIFRYNQTTGYWNYVRSCLPENAARWLEIFRADHPQDSFCVAQNRPTHKPAPLS